MPGAVADPPSVSLSFANNFWGKEDAGFAPLLERMHHAKVTGDELKSFYAARAAIEDDYARKLLSLARKPLGSCETGTLRMSLDVVRGEVESMGKAHQNISLQMKTDLDEQLTAFHGGMKERRKIVQGGIEKLHKTKTQQTIAVNKTRDKFEQDCLKIKGYLAQGHMVMGQEERKNKAKLEKTQIQLSAASNEYETAVRVLEETTSKWNREWKIACDKFQDLEEERIDFMKSSLWSFANIASTVCVTDDASCEKIRLSLEDCDVEKDISTFIRDSGTGQEIPDAPKFINFCREDLSDDPCEASGDDSYSVAQFQRSANPAFRTSSPQPSPYESTQNPEAESTSGIDTHNGFETHEDSASVTSRQASNIADQQSASRSPSRLEESHQFAANDDYPQVPYNEYPEDGMTQFCRTDQPSEVSSAANSGRPSSRDSQSEYSNPTSFSSLDPSVASPSPTKQLANILPSSEGVQKKKSGFFQNRSPFRRKSKNEKENPRKNSTGPSASKRSTWGPSTNSTQSTQPPPYGQTSRSVSRNGSTSPEPADPRANFQLNVGNNVFDVASPDGRTAQSKLPTNDLDEADPIAKALADLKGVGKQSSVRQSADRYHGIASASDAGTMRPSGRQKMADRSVQPPSYEPVPVSHLDAPQPAFTSRQMQQTTQKYIDQKQSVFDSPASRNNQTQTSHNNSQRGTPQSRPSSRNGAGPISRATSPSPYRSTSPRPLMSDNGHHGPPPRAASPSPYGGVPNQAAGAGPNNSNRPRAYSSHPSMPRNGASYNGNQGYNISRAASPQPQYSQPGGGGDMALQLAPGPDVIPSPYQNQAGYGNYARGRPAGVHPGNNGQSRPASTYGAPNTSAVGMPTRERSRSVADGQKFTRDGRPILHFSRAMYMYQAAIPEEMSFAKSDVLAILRHQDDGWWEAEIVGKNQRPGLVPSNYLQNC